MACVVFTFILLENVGMWREGESCYDFIPTYLHCKGAIEGGEDSSRYKRDGRGGGSEQNIKGVVVKEIHKRSLYSCV